MSPDAKAAARPQGKKLHSASPSKASEIDVDELDIQQLRQELRKLTEINHQLTSKLHRTATSTEARLRKGASFASYDHGDADSSAGKESEDRDSEVAEDEHGVVGALSACNTVSISAQSNKNGEAMTRRQSKSSTKPGVSKVCQEDWKIEGSSSGRSVSKFGVNHVAMRGSALSRTKPVQITIYLVAFAGVVFTLVAKATHLGEGDTADDDHRRLGGEAPPLMTYIAYALVCAGIVAMIINFIKQPLILGYLLGGVLVGPHALSIIPSHEDISTLSSLGLIFLLFMVGLELNVSALLKMGKVVLVTGALQFPICAGLHILAFMGLGAVGFDFGQGSYSTFYCGLVCGISSTMIVVKQLSAKCDTDSPPGRLTIGILIFQDIWAILVLAVQPNFASPDVAVIGKTFGMIAVLLTVAVSYAKFVMPAVLYSSSKNVELMLVLSLAWCFFVGCVATLPFIGLSYELASLIAGVALAAFPYSAEFNGKIKYIRDFFITLFFVGLGMQIPPPTFGAVSTGVVIALVVLAVRWIGIYSIVRLMGGRDNLAGVATVNLSQVSEFALVICSLGLQFEHIEDDTLTIIIWTFAVLAVASSYFIDNNRAIYGKIQGFAARLCGRRNTSDSAHDDSEHEEHDILILGFHKVAAMLLGELKTKEPDIIKRVHVVDCDEEALAMLKQRGIKSSYGDISSADVMEHVHHGEAKLVLSTISDSLLQGNSNMKMLKMVKQLWPDARFLGTAEHRIQAELLYKNGAAFVLRVEKLCSERLSGLVREHLHSTGLVGSELEDVFESHMSKDMKRGSSMIFH